MSTKLYEILKYIENDGQSYININNINFVEGDVYSMKYQYTIDVSDIQCIFAKSSFYGVTSRHFNLGVYRLLLGFNIVFKSQNIGGEKIVTFDTDEHIVEFNGNKILYDNEIIEEFDTNIPDEYQANKNVLFAEYNDNHVEYENIVKHGRIFYYNVKRNGNLIEDYIPVKRLSDNAYGVYDRLSKTFYGNSGSGSITGVSLDTPEYITDGGELYLGSIKPNIILGNGIDKVISVGGVNYTELEYIQSTGTQYLTTNIKPNGNEYFRVDFTPTAWDTTTNNVVAGARDSGTLGIYIFGSIAETYGGGARLANFGSNTNFTTKPTLNVKHSVEYRKEKMYYDGTEYTATDRQLVQVNVNMVLFAGNTDSGGQGVSSYTKMKLHTFEVYDASGNVTQKWLPVKRERDGSLGMLDIVNNIFHVNDGSGSFIAGPEVRITPMYLGDVQVQ